MILQQIPQHSGLTLWEGPSPLTGAPIVMIATLQSKNVKTGDMIQTWILDKNTSPIEAVKSDADFSVCGSCRHRGTGGGKARSCYVNVGQAPLNIWRKYRTSGYPRVEDFSFTRNRYVRLGAYGDPAMVPLDILSRLVVGASGWTGYTHQWQWCPSEYRKVLMASVDNETEYQDARSQGWRTFRVRDEDEALAPREFACPASPEGGNRMQCNQCLACNGTKGDTLSDRAGCVSIVVHGSRAKIGGWKVNKNVATA